MKKRLLLGLLCLLLVLGSTLTACKKEPAKDPEEITTAPQEEEEPTLLDTMLPAYDMENREFKMATVYTKQHGWTFEDYTGVTIEEASYRNAMLIRETYNVALTIVEGEGSTLLRTSHRAGLAEYDLVYPTPRSFGTLMIEGTLTDLRSLDYLHFDAEWWNQGQVEAWTTNGKLYCAAGDSTITGQAFYHLIYNRDAYKDKGFSEDLYETVYDGKWTMAKLTEMAKQASVKVDGNDEETFYGFSNLDGVAYAWLNAAGESILKKNQDGKFEMALKSDMLDKIASAWNDLLFGPDIAVVHGTSTSATLMSTEMFTAFAEKRALFMTYDVGSLNSYLFDMDFDIGYLPFPKLTEEQKSYHAMSGSGTIGIPYYVYDEAESALILEAMTICGYEYSRPIFFERIMGARLSEKPEDYEMLQFLHRSKTYDVGFILDTTNVANGMFNKLVIEKNGSYTGLGNFMKSNSALFKELANTANTIK